MATCGDCKRTEEQLDANDIELTERGYCMNCIDERESHMEDMCKVCKETNIGRHALYVEPLGEPICESCDVERFMKLQYKLKKVKMAT